MAYRGLSCLGRPGNYYYETEGGREGGKERDGLSDGRKTWFVKILCNGTMSVGIF